MFPKRCLILIVAVAMASGCAQTRPSQVVQTSAPELPQAVVRARLDFASNDTHEDSDLDELIEIAVKHHPDIQSAYARVEAARGRMIQAGLYPNPILGPNFKRLGEAGHNPQADPGVRFIQPIVITNRLGHARAAGAMEVEAADWQALTRWFDVVTRVRLAYFEFLAAVQERDTLTDIVRVSTKAYQSAQALEKAGAGNRPDVLRAKVELEQNLLKREVSLRRLGAAKENLLTSLGRPPITLDGMEQKRSELERSPPIYDWAAMLECLRDTSSELEEARALVGQQEKLVAKARAEIVPNLTLTAIPYYEKVTHGTRAELFVTAPIPVFDRNQGNVHAAKAELSRAIADERTLELRLTERLTGAYQRYQTAVRQVEAYRGVIVKEARTSLGLIEAGYRAGDKKYDYTAVLQAQQTLFQAELAQTAALADLWRSVTEIAGILQQRDLMSGCAVR